MSAWSCTFPRRVIRSRRNLETNIGSRVRCTINFAAVQLIAKCMSESLSWRGFFNLLTPSLPRRENADSREPIPRTMARIRPRDDLFSAVLIGL